MLVFGPATIDRFRGMIGCIDDTGISVKNAFVLIAARLYDYYFCAECNACDTAIIVCGRRENSGGMRSMLLCSRWIVIRHFIRRSGEIPSAPIIHEAIAIVIDAIGLFIAVVGVLTDFARIMPDGLREIGMI